MTLAAQLQARTFRFAVRIVRVCQLLPPTPEGQEIRRQLIKSGTSTAANYRAACRSRSGAEFIAKIGTVVEEADETVLWLELLDEMRMAAQQTLQELISEGRELVAIFSASQKTAKRNHPSSHQGRTRGGQRTIDN